jgi:predicted ATP-binding protein involved in virulence
MLFHLHSCCPKKKKIADMTGVVLIDDLDLHLHPKWQRIVLPNLAKTFPKLQFVVTSHSPLVATTLHKKNVRFIEDNRIQILDTELFGMSADQVLLSDYFGMDTTRSEAMEIRLASITRRIEDSADPTPAIEYLKVLAGQRNGTRK